MKIHKITFIFLLIIFMLISVIYADTYLISVGIDEYPYGKYPKLFGSTNDARLVESVFPELFQIGNENHILLINNFASKSAIEHFSDLRNWSKNKEDLSSSDILIFYFSGHGIYLPNEEKYYILPYDAVSTNPKTLIEISSLKNLLSSSNARIIIILDCCFSGGHKSIIPFAFKGTKKTFTISKNVSFILSTDLLNPAFDDSSLISYYNNKTLKGHGLFTYYFISSLYNQKGYLPFFNFTSAVDSTKNKIKEYWIKKNIHIPEYEYTPRMLPSDTSKVFSMPVFFNSCYFSKQTNMDFSSRIIWKKNIGKDADQFFERDDYLLVTYKYSKSKFGIKLFNKYLGIEYWQDKFKELPNEIFFSRIDTTITLFFDYDYVEIPLKNPLDRKNTELNYYLDLKISEDNMYSALTFNDSIRIFQNYTIKNDSTKKKAFVFSKDEFGKKRHINKFFVADSFYIFLLDKTNMIASIKKSSKEVYFYYPRQNIFPNIFIIYNYLFFLENNVGLMRLNLDNDQIEKVIDLSNNKIFSFYKFYIKLDNYVYSNAAVFGALLDSTNVTVHWRSEYEKKLDDYFKFKNLNDPLGIYYYAILTDSSAICLSDDFQIINKQFFHFSDKNHNSIVGGGNIHLDNLNRKISHFVEQSSYNLNLDIDKNNVQKIIHTENDFYYLYLSNGDLILFADKISDLSSNIVGFIDQINKYQKLAHINWLNDPDIFEKSFNILFYEDEKLCLSSFSFDISIADTIETSWISILHNDFDKFEVGAFIVPKRNIIIKSDNEISKAFINGYLKNIDIVSEQNYTFCALPPNNLKFILFSGEESVPIEKDLIAPLYNYSFRDSSSFIFENLPKASFLIKSLPEETNIYIDNKFKGKTPLTISNLLRYKKYDLKAKKYGYYNYNTTLFTNNLKNVSQFALERIQYQKYGDDYRALGFSMMSIGNRMTLEKYYGNIGNINISDYTQRENLKWYPVFIMEVAGRPIKSLFFKNKKMPTYLIPLVELGFGVKSYNFMWKLDFYLFSPTVKGYTFSYHYYNDFSEFTKYPYEINSKKIGNASDPNLEIYEATDIDIKYDNTWFFLGNSISHIFTVSKTLSNFFIVELEYIISSPFSLGYFTYLVDYREYYINYDPESIKSELLDEKVIKYSQNKVIGFAISRYIANYTDLTLRIRYPISNFGYTRNKLEFAVELNFITSLLKDN